MKSDLSNNSNFVPKGRIAWALITVVGCLAYLVMYLDRGVFIHDTGQLCLAAQRTVSGELPHRDFQESYTGLLTFLNAGGQRLFGPSAISIRIVMLPFFAAFVWAIHSIACRWIPPAAASVLAMCCTVWSVPNYPEAMPSWYNLYFAIYGLWFLLKSNDLSSSQIRTVCLVAAGLCGGISILFKISGLTFLIAAASWLVFNQQLGLGPFRPQVDDQAVSSQPSSRCRRLLMYLPASAVVAVIAVLALAVSRGDDLISQWLNLTLPLAAIAGLIGYNEFRRTQFRLTSLYMLANQFAALALGAAAPVILFVTYYWQQDGLTELINGTLIAPRQRLDFAAKPFPPASHIAFAMPLVLLCVPQLGQLLPTAWLMKSACAATSRQFAMTGGQPAGWQNDSAVSRPSGMGQAQQIATAASNWPQHFEWSFAKTITLVVCSVSLVVCFGGQNAIYFALLQLVRHSAPVAVVVACIQLIRRLPMDAAKNKDELRRQHEASQLFLFAAAATTLGLIQFPFAAMVYCLYSLPVTLLLLAQLFVWSMGYQRRADDCNQCQSHSNLQSAIWTAASALVLVFGAVFFNSAYSCNKTNEWVPVRTVPMEFPNCRHRYAVSESKLYEELASRVGEHLPENAQVLALPDSPEVYFLCNQGNPTPVCYEFFDAAWKNPDQYLSNLLATRPIDVVVEKIDPPFSKGDNRLTQFLTSRFQHQETIYDSSPARRPRFRIYWQDACRPSRPAPK